jgi:hypothetical protein
MTILLFALMCWFWAVLVINDSPKESHIVVALLGLPAMLLGVIRFALKWLTHVVDSVVEMYMALRRMEGDL